MKLAMKLFDMDENVDYVCL